MSNHGLAFPGPRPGVARAQVEGNEVLLENELLAIRWDLTDGPRLIEAVDKRTEKIWSLGHSECFQIVCHESPSPIPRVFMGSEMQRLEPVVVEDSPVGGATSRRSQTFPGKQIMVHLATRDRRLTVRWRLSLRDDANYVRQSVTLDSGTEWMELSEVILLDVPAQEAQRQGSVDGSPAVAGCWFMALEHPMSQTQVESDAKSGQRVRCSYRFAPPLAPGERQRYSTVLGLVPEGQLRRGFLYYLERERAHPYRTFLHHSTGEDLGAIYTDLQKNPGELEKFYPEQEKWWRQCIEDFGRELVAKRGVVIDCFAHDHLWDNTDTPWQFDPARYPEGLHPARPDAERYGANIGIWFSPDGVTGGRERVAVGLDQKLEGFRVSDSNEVQSLALLLSGRRYFARFRAAVVNMLRQYGVGYFKFDGIADGYAHEYKPPGAGQWFSDYEALLEIYEELRRLKPDVFINSSTGGWPSPFLLLWADCIWHQGADVGLFGPQFEGWSKGTPRQRWLTYRDSATYHNGWLRGPLYPLNSYMLHGLEFNLTSRGPEYGRERVRGMEPKDIVDEIRSFFGTGTNLQEMHLTASLMTPESWDILAEAANWSRSNADVLVDTHWVGGDPAQDQVYGWASWTPRKGILTLRNPDDAPQTLALDIAQVFELPEGAPQSFQLKSPWHDQADMALIDVGAGQPHEFRLEPFEVQVFDATPT